jgi:hypothetical protein
MEAKVPNFVLAKLEVVAERSDIDLHLGHARQLQVLP